MEKCQKKWLDSAVNVPAPWRRLRPRCLLTLLNKAAFNLHPAWSGPSDCKRGANYLIPARRAKTDLIKSCSIPFCQWGVQWFCQDHGECQPTWGQKHEGGVSQGTGDGSVLVISTHRGGDQLLMKYPYVTHQTCLMVPAHTPPPGMDLSSIYWGFNSWQKLC